MATLLQRDRGKTHGLGLNDALIAATALTTGRVLLTLNGLLGFQW